MATKTKAKVAKASHDQASSSKVFDHFRSVGLITEDCPFDVQSRGGACFVTCSIGKTFHIYDVKGLCIDEYSSF